MSNPPELPSTAPAEGEGAGAARKQVSYLLSASLGPIAMGVYECDSPAAVGGSIMGRPVTGFFFGVTAPGAYRDFDGGRGAFSLNGDVLTMTSGPLRGIRYRRQAAGLFRPLDAQGQIGPIRCVLNRAKALTGRW